MNQSILVRFHSSQRSLRVKEFKADTGLEFDDHPDASPLILGIGVQPLIPAKIPPRFLHDGKFLLDVTIDDGALRLSGFQGDPKALPIGTYDITVEVESFRFRNPWNRVSVDKDRQSEITLEEEVDPRQVALRGNIDKLTSAVLRNANSMVDGKKVMTWLKSPLPRPARKACLLNILAKMRVPALTAAGFGPMTEMLRFIFFADVDRIYGGVDNTLKGRLEDLVKKKVWVKEGKPGAAIHKRLLDRLGPFGFTPEEAAEFPLTSYRQGGRNCLQMVVAEAPGGLHFADIDIDLGNPLWDLEGLFIHLGELLDPGKTDHLKLHDKLDRGDTKDFLYYDVVGG